MIWWISGLALSRHSQRRYGVQTGAMTIIVRFPAACSWRGLQTAFSLVLGTWKSCISMISPISPTTSISSARLHLQPGLGCSLQRHEPSLRRYFREARKKLRSSAPPLCLFAMCISRAGNNGADVSRGVTPNVHSWRRSFPTCAGAFTSVHPQAVAAAMPRCGCRACGSSIWQLAFT